MQISYRMVCNAHVRQLTVPFKVHCYPFLGLTSLFQCPRYSLCLPVYPGEIRDNSDDVTMMIKIIIIIIIIIVIIFYYYHLSLK